MTPSSAPNPNNVLRVALIGCGIISENHIRAYQQHPDRAHITVCCDIDEEKARQRAQLVGGDTRAVTDLDAILDDPEVDAVEICTPHHLHTEIVLQAARAKKHVLCQKPLAKTLDECDRMIAAANEANIVLFYGETNRTLPAAVSAKEAIDAGRIGELVGLQATYAHWQGGRYMTTAWRYDPTVSGGGQLLDGGIHFINLLHHLGGPVAGVSAFTNRVRPELGGEDTAVVNLRFDGGHLGTLFSSQAAGIWYPGAGVVVFGTEGVLSLGGADGGALVLHRPDLPEKRAVLLEKNGDGFAVMIGHYLDTVLDGKPNPSPGTIGRDDLQTVLAAYESAKIGREVLLNAL